MGERLRAIVLAAVVWMVGHPHVSKACSCGGDDDRFLVETGTVLPANARGVPWWGTVDQRRGDPEGMPAKSRFSVEHLDGIAWRSIDFDIVRLPTERVHGVPNRFDETVWVIAPDRGLVPQSTYRFRARTLPWFIPGEMEPGPADDQSRELVVDVSVAAQPFDSDGSAPTLGAEPTQSRDLRVTTFAGSCSTGVHAATVDFALKLEPPMDKVQRGLLFSTLVDGRPWRPTAHLCGRLAPGESWVGRTRERIFAPCAPERGVRDAEPAFGVEPGTHEVEMIAWLPGTPIEFRAHTTIELSCPTAAP